jgi:hypothetical protein
VAIYARLGPIPGIDSATSAWPSGQRHQCCHQRADQEGGDFRRMVQLLARSAGALASRATADFANGTMSGWQTVSRGGTRVVSR